MQTLRYINVHFPPIKQKAGKPSVTCTRLHTIKKTFLCQPSVTYVLLIFILLMRIVSMLQLGKMYTLFDQQEVIIECEYWVLVQHHSLHYLASMPDFDRGWQSTKFDNGTNSMCIFCSVSIIHQIQGWHQSKRWVLGQLSLEVGGHI